MRKVKMLNLVEEKESKPIELTHGMVDGGWAKIAFHNYEGIYNLTYLGKCTFDGDIFFQYSSGVITIYKGHLNDGTY